ncbi:MAG: hypothetical protein P4M09_29295 [Devosia sp.]|nr:hypothetical protein [Devosia sp.]
MSMNPTKPQSSHIVAFEVGFEATRYPQGGRCRTRLRHGRAASATYRQ